MASCTSHEHLDQAPHPERPDLTRLFKLLACTTRRDILLEIIREPRTGTQLMVDMELPQPVVAKNLKDLARGGLISGTKSGCFCPYRMNSRLVCHTGRDAIVLACCSKRGEVVVTVLPTRPSPADDDGEARDAQLPHIAAAIVNAFQQFWKAAPLAEPKPLPPAVPGSSPPATAATSLRRARCVNRRPRGRAEPDP